MRKNLLFLSCILLSWANIADAQRMCGMEAMKAALIKQSPTFAQHLQQVRAEQLTRAQQYEQQTMGITARTTAETVVIPVIFHIILNQEQIDSLGGTAGIDARINSQMFSLNQDFTAQNPDYVKIPSAFMPLYGNMDMKFGLAKLDPQGNTTPGYEIKVTTLGGFSAGNNEGFGDAKHISTGGLDAWDVNKYINVWIVAPLGSGLVGTTVPRSYTDPQQQPAQFLMPVNEIGITVHYGAFGVIDPSDFHYVNFTGGRTLTHEMGHYFELWHTWGDDGGLCPGNGGADDGIADTPPQGTWDYGCPTFPNTDACSPVAPGTMFMNFLNYVDDDCMHLFSKGQVTLARSQIVQGGESYSLTQHPELAQKPLAVNNVVASRNSLTIMPNPTTGKITIVPGDVAALKSINIFNITGQEVTQIITNNNNTYTADLSGMGKGIYFVQCRFDNGMVTRKIVLQ